MSTPVEESDDPLKGIVFFKNKLTGKVGLYLAFELEPDHEYSIQLTADGEQWDEIQHKSTKGLTHDIYLSFNVPDPGNGLWPRVIDLGPSP